MSNGYKGYGECDLAGQLKNHPVRLTRVAFAAEGHWQLQYYVRLVKTEYMEDAQ